MNAEIGGYGYEFDTKHFGGPFDGLDSSVISFIEFPPKSVFYPLPTEETDFLEVDKTLGKKLLKKWQEPHIPGVTKVAVYTIEGDPEEYNDEDVINYHFKSLMTYSEYKSDL
jgi:hypothetical protein